MKGAKTWYGLTIGHFGTGRTMETVCGCQGLSGGKDE